MTTSTERRRTWRRRLVIGSVLPALVVLVLAIRLLTLPIGIGQAQDAHERGDGDGVREAGSSLGVLNVVERWRAPFVEGTGASMGGDLEEGRTLLELALERTDKPEDDCTVRTNLVLTVSAQADRAKEEGDEKAEKAFAEEGLELIEQGPEGCLNGQQDGNGGDAGRTQREQQKKLEKQSGQGEGQGEGEQGEGEDGEQGEDPQEGEDQGDGKREELEERNTEGQRESNQRGQGSETDGGGGTGPGVDKPW